MGTKVINSQIMVGFGRSALQANAIQYDGAIPADDVASKLFGWDAVPAPLFATVNGHPVVIPGNVANLRSDTHGFLGLVSERYEIHQYADALLGNVRAILGNGLGINAAGTNRGGAVGWVSVSLPEAQVTAEGIEYLPQLIAYSSHDGTLATEYKRSVLNMVCNNQMGHMLSRGTGETSKVRVKHTRNSALRIENARQALGIIMETAETFAETARELCRTPVTAAEWDAIVDELCGPMPETDGRGRTLAESKREEIHGLYKSDPRCAPWAGTAYGAVQTMNTWATHLQTVRGAHRDERNLLATLAGDWDRHDARTIHAVRAVLTRSHG